MQSTTPTTWTRVMERWAGDLELANRSPRTIELRTYQIRRFFLRTGLRLEEVTKDDLKDYLRNPAWSPNTKQVVRSSFTGFFGFAVEEGVLVEDPSHKLPHVKVPKGKPKPASDEAVADALANATARVRMMITLGALVGLRAMEIAACSTEDVTLTEKGATLRIQGKGDKTRIVPLSDEVAELILYNHDGYLFPSRDGGHIQPAYVSRLVSKALPPGVTCHKLRHRFATRAYRNTHNLRAVQLLLGHASVATTEIYTGIDDDELRSAALSAA